MQLLNLVLSVCLAQSALAFPSSRHEHHNNKADKQRPPQQQHGKDHIKQQQHGGRQEQVSRQRTSNDLPINEMQHAAAAEYPTSAFADVSLWEYNIFFDAPASNFQADEDYDYSDDYYDDADYNSQNLILLAAIQPRRNRNVFGLPPREVVIY